VAQLNPSPLVRARPGHLFAAAGSQALVCVLALATALTLAAPASAADHKSTTTTTKASTTTTAPGPAADKWLIAAIGAEVKVGSVHVNGFIHQGKTLIKLNLVVNGDGEGGGTFEQGNYPIQLKRVGPLLYFNAPKQFWATHATAAQTKLYGGKWIEVSALDERFLSFVQFLDAADLVQVVFQGHKSPLTLAHSATIDGRKMIVIKDTERAGGKSSTGLMYVSAKGTPFVYRIVDHTPGEVSTLNFGSYGRPVSIVVPPAAINLT
jgi:hypothetical protein